MSKTNMVIYMNIVWNLKIDPKKPQTNLKQKNTIKPTTKNPPGTNLEKDRLRTISNIFC